MSCGCVPDNINHKDLESKTPRVLSFDWFDWHDESARDCFESFDLNDQIQNKQASEYVMNCINCGMLDFKTK